MIRVVRNSLSGSLIIEGRIHCWIKYQSISSRKNVPNIWSTVQTFVSPLIRPLLLAQTLSLLLRISVNLSNIGRFSNITVSCHLISSLTMMTMQQMMKRRLKRWRSRCIGTIWWPRYKIRSTKRWKLIGFTSKPSRYRRWKRNREERGNCSRKRRNSGR